MSDIKIFESINIRTHWDEEKQDWLFSVVDIIKVLTDSTNPRNYWKVLKHRLSQEGSELVTYCNQLKMKSADGKFYKTDTLDTKWVLRLVQSIPSPKAEPFKMWLANIGSERLDEIVDPEQSFERGIKNYSSKGYSNEWINQRLMSIEIRKELTDEWQTNGLDKNKDYAILTNEMTKAWSGKSIKDYKNYKNLKKENLRDNMTNLELVLNMLAEATTTEISKSEKPKGLNANLEVVRRSGNIAGNTRKEIEKETHMSIISKNNASSPTSLDQTKQSLLSELNDNKK